MYVSLIQYLHYSNVGRGLEHYLLDSLHQRQVTPVVMSREAQSV